MLDMLLFVLIFIISGVATYLFRCHALNVNWLDVPNERSSHVLPVARGGGVVFVVIFLCVISVYAFYSIHPSLIAALALIGINVASIGWLDDRFHVSALLRLMIHMVSSIMALFLIGFFQHPWGEYSLIVNLFAVVYLTGIINVFNFLDGIDGYAMMEASFVAICIGGLSALADIGIEGMLTYFAAAVLGFGVWNFPRARIFMGDVGSGFLGGMLGVFSLYTALFSVDFFLSGLILMGLFFVDAGLTIGVRAFRKERIWEAHRQHAYQHLAFQMGAHWKVTLSGLLINVGWLSPWAYLAWCHIVPAWLCLLVAYAPLILIASYWGAGRKIQ